MKRTILALALVATALSLGACSIAQTAKPVVTSATEICVIENPKVLHEEFAAVYQKELTAKGFDVKLLTADSPTNTCPLATTYVANWAWDLATYLVYAEFKVYQDGQAVGEAIYDARGGGGNLNKFIKADVKIKELVELLFPKGPR